MEEGGGAREEVYDGRAVEVVEAPVGCGAATGVRNGLRELIVVVLRQGGDRAYSLTVTYAGNAERAHIKETSHFWPHRSNIFS